MVPRSQSGRDRKGVEEQAGRDVEQCGLGRVPPGYHRLVDGILIGPNQPPIVDAGPDQGLDLGSSVQLHGSVTDDGRPNDHIEVAWSKVNGPGDVMFASPASEDTDVTFSQAGMYVLMLTASDGELSAFDEVQIVVQSANAAPVADAGPDLSITLPQRSVTIQGAVGDDGRPLPTPNVSWSLLSGPGPVTFVPPTSAATTATFPEVGAYELRLSADDGQKVKDIKLEALVSLQVKRKKEGYKPKTIDDEINYAKGMIIKASTMTR